jgi:hypothetical protein
MKVMRLVVALAFAALSCAAASAEDPGVLLESGDYRWVPLHIRRAPVQVDAAFEVEDGDPTVHIEIVAEGDFRPMQRGLRHDSLSATDVAMSGSLRYRIDTPGDYRVIVTNKSGAKPALVNWRVSTALTPAPVATELSPRRRVVTIVVSFLLFFAMAGYSGWRLRSAAQS